MGLLRFKPMPSGRMGILWTLASVREAAIVEFGCMGHMMYSGVTLENAGVRGEGERFSTHIDETDISLGQTGKLAATIDHVIRHVKPRVIFLLPSSIPEIIGMDIAAEAKALQKNWPDTLILPLGYGGFHVTQHRGIQETLLHLVQVLPKEVERTPEPTFNIIGSCADLFRFQADAQEIIRIMEGSFGIRPLCVLTSDTSISDIEHMGAAHINLVIRREGEAAAIHLQKNFATPYLKGRPYGAAGTGQWIREIAGILNISPASGFVDRQIEEVQQLCFDIEPNLKHFLREHPGEIELLVGAHADVVKGIIDFGCSELSLPKGTCWCDCPEMASDVIPYFTENQWSSTIQSQGKGLVMASGEALDWANRDSTLQISNPDVQRRLNPYVPPFVGFRGAIHLIDLWMNAIVRQEDVD